MKIYFLFFSLISFCAGQDNEEQNLDAVPLYKYNEIDGPEPFIISGNKATLGQFPHQAALVITLTDGSQVFCGGSLIDEQWILTAGHCAANGVSWIIKLGGIKSNFDEENTAVVISDTAYVHPNYNSANLNNDIALIKLPSPVTLTENIKPVNLPRILDAGNPLSNVKVTVSGWGKTSNLASTVSANLNWVNLNTITNAKCRLFFNSQIVIDSTLCCKGFLLKSTCNGDSGGPLIHKAADGQVTQVGVVSFVPGLGCGLGPSGYVRTGNYLLWINEITGIALRQ